MTSSDEEKLTRLAYHEGWEVLARVMQERIGREQDSLAQTKFENLLEVGRAQGQITSLQQMISFVERRREKHQGG